MTEQSNEQRGGSFLVTVAALVIIAWGVYQAGSVLQLLLVSVFLAVMGTPLLFWFERKRVPSGVAVLLVVGAIIGILLVVGALVGTSLNNFSNAMPAYQARIQEQFSRLTELLASKGIESPARLALKYVNPGAVMSLTQSLLSGLSSVLSNIVLILITVTFILLEASSFPAKLRAALGVPQTAFSQLSRFVDTMKRYIIIQTATNLTEGVLDGSGLPSLVWISLFSGVSWSFCSASYRISVLLSLPFLRCSWLSFNWGSAVQRSLLQDISSLIS